MKFEPVNHSVSVQFRRNRRGKFLKASGTKDKCGEREKNVERTKITVKEEIENLLFIFN